MKRRILSIVLVISMIFGCSALSVTASDDTYETYKSDGYEYEILNNGNIQIIDYYGSDRDAVIPSEIDGRKVTSIGEFAFSSLTWSNKLLSVVIPDTVTSIKMAAFFCCASLQSVTIPYGVKTIGICAFFGCESLNEITIPKSVYSIGADAFLDTALYNDESNWEDNVLYIGCNLISGSRFKLDKSTGDFKVAAKVKGDYVVKHGTRLIASEAFLECILLDNITIPASVTSMGSHCVGFHYSEKADKYIINSDCIIHCYENTVAQSYANKNWIRRELIEGTFGDANRDDNIDLLDVLQVRKYIAKQPVETDYDLSDVNCDGAVDMLDVLLVRKYIAKQPVTLGPQA